MQHEKIDRCPVCGHVLMPHELALFHSGKGNLVQLHTKAGAVWVHRECAEGFATRNELLRYVTGGEEDRSWLE